MPALKMLHTVDPRDALLERLGDTSKIEVFNNLVLVAIYERPEKTSGGLILPGQNLAEDRHQSKVGLVIRTGPSAFVSDGNWFNGIKVDVGDWILFRASDGWRLDLPARINGRSSEVPCRMLEDVAVKGRIDHPDRVW